MIRGFLLPFISMIILSGCLPQESARVPVTNELSTNNDQNSGFETPDSSENNATQEEAYFYSSGNKLQTLTIDYDNSDVHYVFGGDVDQYLKSTNGIKSYQVINGVSTPIYNYTYEETFCVSVKFTQTFSQSPNELRVLAIPASTMNFTTGVRTRYFRLKLNTSEGNNFCNKTIDNQNGSFTTPPASLVYDTDDICPSCNNIISSQSVTLYKYDDDSNYLVKVDDGRVKASGLTLRIDMNGQAGSGTSTCTDSQCNSQGFDCCINGQCVNEAALILSGVSSDPAGFANAENEKTSDPNWYLNYPQFYYSCLEEPAQDPDDPLDPEDPTGEAQARIEALYEDYKCIEQLREFAEEDPYVRDYTDTDLPVSQGNYTECSFNTSDNMYYQTVLKRMYDECGCAEKDDLSLMVTSCPAYHYTATFVQDANGDDTDEVINIACFVPPVENGPLPFEDRDVAVNARTAPHRFFNEDNEEYSLEEAVPDGANTTQEGTTFQYLDEEKLFPLNGSFNMNSILGNINVNLTEARPAKVIDVEFDKVYYLAAISGYYTPCPSCSKDSWFANFTAFPSTQQGHGVRATGYTTKRSEWGTNSSLANYEDLIFGRACFIPPTMIPYSHSAIDGNDAQDQRLNRLKTQAALYVNGYQRDWFGFNKGALIGSFDGVTWFAIGKNRIVRATSDKLFLAINAPFADLANPNDQIVHVAEYDFISTGARYDYKDTAEINDVDQNDGGLCQRYHQCDTDTDCITQLGWEYVCANVTQTKTKWPVFEPIGAIEKNDEERLGNIVQFLQQGELPPDTPTLKRCIYRGAGAPCRIDYENIDNYNLRKSLSCAPNFYCASLSSNNFNKEVARFGNSLDAVLEPKNHLIGRDANVLGRPKDYVGASNALEPAIISTLKANLLESDSNIANQEGLCVPGKSLPDYISTSFSTNTNQIEQQKEKDPNGRTDYISQISGCNSSLHTIMRYSSCPMIDTDGNYLHVKDDYIDDLIEINFGIISGAVDAERATQFYSLQQNVCGLENIQTSATIGQGTAEESLRSNSAFKLIYGRDLASSDTQIEPILAQNACFRRAGAVCHTDLDCAPGKKHFEVLDIIDPDYFGNEPERKYWEEYLVCGQMENEPILSSQDSSSIEAFNEWNMSNNRCCREVGKDITMYTEDTPTQPETDNLRTDIYGGVNANDPRRYSRYMNASPLMRQDPYATYGAFVAEFLERPSANTENNSGVLQNATNITNPNQWITFSETGGRTCCGGSWIRKFADGSNNWSINRLNLDVTNFKCLNYKSPLILTENPEVYDLKNSQLNNDLSSFCPDPTGAKGNCVQHPFTLASENGESDKETRPRLDDTTTTMWINSGPDATEDSVEIEDNWTENLFTFGLFKPTDLTQNIDGSNGLYLNWISEDWDTVYGDGETRNYIAVKIPSFVTFKNNNYDNPNVYSPSPGFDQSDEDSNPKAPLRLRVQMENPIQDDPNLNEKYFECDHITTITDYTCASTSGWGGLCDPIMQFGMATWDNTCTGASACCFMYNQVSRELRVSYSAETICEVGDYDVDSCSGTNDDNFGNFLFHGSDPLSLRIEFTAAGSLKWEQEKLADLGATSLDDATLISNPNDDTMFYHRRSSEPGHALYYLEKLARMELLGIPQIAYEPIFCNDNYQKMVPNLFINELDNPSNGGDGNGILTSFDWMNSDLTFIDPQAIGNWDVGINANGNPQYDPGAYYGNDEFRAGTFEVVNHPKVFSENEFMCCKPLGAEVREGEDALCCSGHAVEVTSGGGSGNTTTDDTEKFICKLPVGTDLHVYLNRFVSGEGADFFEATDFNERTGELKSSEEIQAKVQEFGRLHCDGGDEEGTVVAGGAFGEYLPEPYPAVTPDGNDPAPIMSIVDSQFDDSDAAASGYEYFRDGYRWNHHLYCGDAQ
jgi:hypothetical protein